MAIHYDENLYKTWTMSPPLIFVAFFDFFCVYSVGIDLRASMGQRISG